MRLLSRHPELVEGRTVVPVLRQAHHALENTLPEPRGIGLQPGRRICVVGTSGCGKTYVAEALAEKLGLTYICNDAIIWQADWQPAPQAEVLAEVGRATSAEGWTFDGNLVLSGGGNEEDRIAFDRCDTLVWLDLPRWQVHGQVIIRSFQRVLTSKPMWRGNIERWRTLFSADSIVWWSVKTFARRRRKYGALFEGPEYKNRILIHLRSRGEVKRWLAGLTKDAVRSRL
jgi:adenylate kinase family enzyme